MQAQIRHCPYCGGEFGESADERDSRIPSGYRCETCDAVLEIWVNRYSEMRSV